jgi:hypothetical protein
VQNSRESRAVGFQQQKEKKGGKVTGFFLPSAHFKHISCFLGALVMLHRHNKAIQGQAETRRRKTAE